MLVQARGRHLPRVCCRAGGARALRATSPCGNPGCSPPFTCKVLYTMICPPLLLAVWRRVAELHQVHAEPWQSLCQQSSRRAFVLYAWRIIPRHAYSSGDGEHTTDLLRDLSPL